MGGSSTQKSRLYARGGMHQWGVNYWYAYTQEVNWVSFRAIITLSILRELHTKSVDFVLAYTHADIKSEIFMELPICFGFEG